jgi:transmembrane sensor
VKASKLKQILKKYEQGKASAAEKYLIDTWYESFQDDDQRSQELLTASDEELIRQRLKSKLIPVVPFRLWYQQAIWKVAAVVLLTFTITVLSFYFKPDSPQKVAVMDKREIFNTGSQQLKKIQLSDSTLVWLNANSTLEILPAYGKIDRKVNLSGEAYFEVQKNPNKRFSVVTDHLQIEVLGTSFNVRSYAKLSSTQITVNTGKVRVGIENRTIATIAPNQQLLYDKNNGEHQMKTLRDFHSASWKEGKIYLEKASFMELKQAVYNLYGAKLSSQNKAVNTYKYNLVLRSDQPLEELMEVITNLLHKKYKKEGNHVFII